MTVPFCQPRIKTPLEPYLFLTALAYIMAAYAFVAEPFGPIVACFAWVAMFFLGLCLITLGIVILKQKQRREEAHALKGVEVESDKKPVTCNVQEQPFSDKEGEKDDRKEV